jgi:predicted permease
MTISDLKLRARAMFRPNQVERELDDELSFHIERETARLIEQGVPPDDARLQARARFGSPTVVADDCRDERGTALLDNTIRDMQYAFRSFRRAPLASLTIAVTVSIGLGAVAVLFTVLNTFLFRVDNVPGVSEMYSVQRPLLADNVLSLFPRARLDAMRTETNVFTDAFGVVPNVDLRIDGRTMAAVLVTGNFFDVLGVRPVMGRAITAADDGRAGGNAVIVLSDKGWRRRFDNDPLVIGKTVLIRDVPFQIVGVMPAGFRGLEVSGPDFWAPLSQLEHFKPGQSGLDDQVGVDIVGRLKPGVSPERARAQLAAWDSNQSAPTTEARTTNISLVPRRGTVPQPMEAVAIMMPLFAAFGLILLIGCANVANLLLARGVARQREIGIRLSIGASRRRIVRQLMTESLLLALAAAAGGYIISRLALEELVYRVMQAMPVDVGDVNLNVPAADWRVALFLVLAAVAATAFFALMPALQATRIDPVRALRGELVKDARPGRARNALIAVQVFASALLLILATIFLRSSLASSLYDPGFRTADTIMIEMINQPKREAMLQQIASDPEITAYAAVRPGMLDQRWGFAETEAGKTPVGYKFVSGGSFDVMGIPILRGRAFTAAERDDYPVAIVADAFARQLWPNADAVGQTFRIEPDPQFQPKNEPPMPARIVTVVGVSRDIAGFRITDVKQPSVFLPTSVDAPKTALMARIVGDADLARQRILERLTKIDPNMGMIVMMKTVARLETFFLNIAFWVSLVLGALALLLTVSGLFSVLSYLVEQRTKEIGVRMALGAAAKNVTRMMLSQTARPVVYGLTAGVGLAVILATALLATDLGALLGPIVHVTDPVAYVSSLAVIVAACLIASWLPATRASRLDPMKTLRQE